MMKGGDSRIDHFRMYHRLITLYHDDQIAIDLRCSFCNTITGSFVAI